jgi:class 3 adenylate cyclase
MVTEDLGSCIRIHTNLAARIEPIAEEGPVDVSGEFAAMATVAGGNQFQFGVVAQRPLPKKAGVIPVFRLAATAVSSRVIRELLLADA